MPELRDPLVPAWQQPHLAPQRAGERSRATITLRNDGSATWRSFGADGLQLSYHWLDLHGNAIVWDGPRVAFPNPVAPGADVALEVDVTAPRAPGRYVLRFDLVEEHRFWLSEIGVPPLDLDVVVAPRIDRRRLAVVVHGGPDPDTTAALACQDEALVDDDPEAVAHLVSGATPGPDWARLLLDAHAEGWAVVGPALTPGSAGLERRRDMRRYADWAPGGRNPRFGRPLLLPSLLVGRSPELGGALPAASPGEDGLFEGRAVVRLPTRSGRRLS